MLSDQAVLLTSYDLPANPETGDRLQISSKSLTQFIQNFEGDGTHLCADRRHRDRPQRGLADHLDRRCQPLHTPHAHPEGQVALRGPLLGLQQPGIPQQRFRRGTSAGESTPMPTASQSSTTMRQPSASARNCSSFSRFSSAQGGSFTSRSRNARRYP
jgi:hypothetical protein